MTTDVAKLDRVLDRMSEGETIVAACRAEGVPRRTFYDRVRADKDLEARKAQAEGEGIDALADRLMETAVDGSKDKVEGLVDVDHIARARLKAETLRWFLSKLAPRRYGDKLGVEHSGGLALQVVTGVPTAPSDNADLV